MFGRKQEVRPIEQTYTQVAEELHFGVTSSVSDQVASAPFRNSMGKYIAHRMAVERGEAALGAADLAPAEKAGYIRQFAEEDKISRSALTQIKQQLETSRIDVQALPEIVLQQIAANLALPSQEENNAEAADGPNVTDQLLADANTKSGIKQQRQEQREQEKSTKTQAKDFSKAQEETAKQLEKGIDLDGIEQRTDKLTATATALEQQAKREEEREAPKQVPADYEKEMLSRQLNKQLREPESDPGLSSDEVGLQ